MNSASFTRKLIQTLITVMLLTGSLGNIAQAGMVSTQAMIVTQGESYTKSDLQTALASEELKGQLQSMGVDLDQLNDRIASLTPDEIQQLNAELEKQPAGGIVGALVTVFVVLVVTDLLCATDIFSFVNCINK
ncbi:MAG: hypothetical protein COB04_11615 [Gammaproteobacteria bacterium]|nr:MAG: hypothetical protein COB04_11615 [Gammaproteobacteria bacterium]